MLKHGEVNPLNVFGLRQLTHCPPHFERVQFDLSSSEKDITDWIYENLQGRFYIGSVDVKQPDSRPTFRQALVAFENASEASYFSLFLPQINQAKVFW
jgi:hypothetical protein